MAKGYWITFYRSIKDAGVLAEYARLAGPAIEAGGGKFLARGLPVKSYEAGLNERTVLIEFASATQAMATYEGAAYQVAAKVLNGAVEREVRIVEGV
jgi:uncharacterized protein (DUF1330 family)